MGESGVGVKTRVKVIVAAAVLAVSLLPSPRVGASPTPPPIEVWLMEADGSNAMKVAEGRDVDGLDWAPDGTRFAHTQGALFVVDASTGQQTALTEWPERPVEVAWSPDGSTIAYSFFEDEIHGLRTISPEGENKETLFTYGPENSSLKSGLDWSPDGSSLSFIAGPDDGLPGRLHVIDVATGTTEQVAATDAVYDVTRWSPDGAWIAFRGWGGDLWVVRPDGSDAKNLSGDLESAGDPDWRPDSTEVAFTRFDADTWESEVVAVSPITGITRLLVSNATGPSWSPDASRLAYESDADIYALDLSGGDPDRLTSDHLQDDAAPDWSPDGSHIAFTRTRVQVFCPFEEMRYPIEATIVGTDDDDILEGTPERDVIAGRGGNDTLRGFEGNDVLCGGPGDDTVEGGGDDDRLFGEAGSDVLRGASGDDFLDGGEGSDLFFGGRGVDIASFWTSATGVSVDLGTGVATGQGTDSLSGIEDLRGSPKPDRLEGDRGPNWIKGAAWPWENPSDGDVLLGRGGDDHLQGFAGRDRLRGGRGADHLDGGRDKDDCRGGPGTDSLRSC